MARPKKPVSIDDEIAKQEETVAKLREKYDENVRKLKDLYAKRDEEKKKALLNAVSKVRNQVKTTLFLVSDVVIILLNGLLIRNGSVFCLKRGQQANQEQCYNSTKRNQKSFHN